MKSYLILLPIFLFALIQGAFLRLNLVLLVVLIWSVLSLQALSDKAYRKIFFVAFTSGLFLDLSKGTCLGLSSLLLLVFCFLLLAYSRKLDPLKRLFLPAFIFLSSSVYLLITDRFNWLEGLILAALVLLVKPLVKHFSSGFGSREIHLKL